MGKIFLRRPGNTKGCRGSDDDDDDDDDCANPDFLRQSKHISGFEVLFF